MAKLSKPFRFATEGNTCDGRTISRQDIVDMAATYKRETYSARANMEHIRGFSADPPFCAYGDVADGLTTQEVNLSVGGKTEKRLALVGQVDALDNLVSLNAKGQKLYPSIEINPNFAGSGKAYLQGLAFTDSPASLGTEIMQFAAGAGAANPFLSRKIDPGNFFSAVDEGVILEFEDATEQAPTESSKLFAAATAFFQNFAKGGEKPAEPAPAAPTPPANDNDMAAAIGAGFEKLSAAMTAMSKETKTAIGELRSDHDALKASIENTDGGQQRRAPAAGGNAHYAKADF